jgi:Fe2+-dicitrate sensor, membrane component
MNEYNEELFIKFALGTASDEEVKELGELVAREPQAAVELEKYLRAAALASKENIDEDSIAELLRKKRRRYIGRIAKQTIRYAAIFVGILILGVGILRTSSYIKNGSQNEHVEMLAFTTLPGQVKKLTLADGTNVWLAPASRFIVPKVFSKEKRVVQLYGEAYFEVAHNPKQPFEVKTHNSKVCVLGTKFNVHAYANETYEQTALLEGKVKVDLYAKGKLSGHEVLAPNNKVSLNTETGKYEISKADFNSILAWKLKRLVFNNEKFKDIAKKLERFYNINLQFSDTILTNQRFTAEFDSEKIEDVFKSFQIVKPFNLNKNGNTYYVSTK